jgi:hypothetical protein
MDAPLTAQMQAVGRDLNTVLARFHAVSRQAPSVVAQDGTLEAVPCSVIESWEVQFQRRLDECKLDKQAVVQRCSREKKEVVDAAMQHIAEINARVTRFERGYLTQVIKTRVLQRALRDADDDLRGQAQQVRMQMEENHALRGGRTMHSASSSCTRASCWTPSARARSRASGGSRPRRPPRSQLAAALQQAGTAREDSARLRRTEPPPRRTVDVIDASCTKAELVQQLSALVLQRLMLAISEEELEAALRVGQLGSSLAKTSSCAAWASTHDHF